MIDLGARALSGGLPRSELAQGSAAARGGGAVDPRRGEARRPKLHVHSGSSDVFQPEPKVLRRLIRRAVRIAYLLGVERPVTPTLVAAVVNVMGAAHPDLARNEDYVIGVAAREEGRFRATLRSGLTMLEGELAGGDGVVSGPVAFRLHDTHGFPIELTREIAAERGARVDEDGFAAAMHLQQEQSSLRKKTTGSDEEERLANYRAIVGDGGPTRFVGYTDTTATARVLDVETLDGVTVDGDGDGRPGRPRENEQSGDLPRCDPVLRRERRPGRRHRPDRDGYGPGAGDRHHLGPAGADPPYRRHRGRRDPGRAGGDGGRRHRTAGGHPAQPHRHPPGALGPPGSPGRPRQAAGIAGRPGLPPVRLHPL